MPWFVKLTMTSFIREHGPKGGHSAPLKYLNENFQRTSMNSNERVYKRERDLSMVNILTLYKPKILESYFNDY